MIINNLKYYREKCGLTQQQVADALNINRSTYTYYEKGKTEPSIYTLQKIMLLFDVGFREIYPYETFKVAEPTAGYQLDRNKADMIFSQLSNEEKDFLLKLRLINEEDKQKIFDELSKMCEGIL